MLAELEDLDYVYVLAGVVVAPLYRLALPIIPNILNDLLTQPLDLQIDALRIILIINLLPLLVPTSIAQLEPDSPILINQISPLRQDPSLELDPLITYLRIAQIVDNLDPDFVFGYLLFCLEMFGAGLED